MILNDAPMAAGTNFVDVTAKLDLPNAWLLARVPDRSPRADRLSCFRRSPGGLHRMTRVQKNRSNDTPVLEERLQFLIY